LYGTDPESFTGEDVSISKSFADQASAVVNARSFCAAAELFRHVAMELERRSVIEGAKGVLIGTSGHTPEEALEELRKRSERDNCGLHDVAAAIVRTS
jgi:AmiR/NasT family two-component response regulator